VVVDDSTLFTTKLQEWADFYNFERPHGREDPIRATTRESRRLQRQRATSVAQLARLGHSRQRLVRAIASDELLHRKERVDGLAAVCPVPLDPFPPKRAA
jgi:hypothetical protein